MYYLKTKFCNLIYSHERDDDERKRIADLLSIYKKVDSLGTYYNNCGKVVNAKEKIGTIKDYKFTIAYESTDQQGFITEKIMDAFLAGSIPIYKGASDVDCIFNQNAFINANNLDDYKLLEIVRKIDENDELFFHMVNQPIFNEKFSVIQHKDRFEKFITNIFEQDYSDAFRRPLGPYKYVKGQVKRYENILKTLSEG